MRRATKPKQQSERNVHVEALLDDALRMTFPASDPIALAVDTGPADAKMETAHAHVHSPRPDPIGTPQR